MRISVKFGAAEKESVEVIVISLFENVRKIPSELDLLIKHSEESYQICCRTRILPEN